jgi:nitroreductase
VLVTSPVINFLLARKSVPIQDLGEPAPSEAEIAKMLRVATRVPDHGRLAPWRFILYRGEARYRIGEMLAALAVEREGELPEPRLDKERTRFSRAPLVIGVIHCPKENPSIPQWEMLLSGAAAAMNLVLAANALGYGSNWITNWYADDAKGRLLLGLAPNERVVGFIHIGTVGAAAADLPDRPRPDPAALVSEYSGPWEG